MSGNNLNNKLFELKSKISDSNYPLLEDILLTLIDGIKDEDFSNPIDKLLFERLEDIKSTKELEEILKEEQLIAMETIRDYNTKILSQIAIKKTNSNNRNNILSKILTKEEEISNLEKKLEINKLAPNNTIKLRSEKQRDHDIYTSELLLVKEELNSLKEKELDCYRVIETSQLEIETLSARLKEYHETSVENKL